MKFVWLAVLICAVFAGFYSICVRRGAMLADMPLKVLLRSATVICIIQLLLLVLSAFAAKLLPEKWVLLVCCVVAAVHALTMIGKAVKNDHPEERLENGITFKSMLLLSLNMLPVSIIFGAAFGLNGMLTLPMFIAGALAAAVGGLSGIMVGMRMGYASKRIAEAGGGAAWLASAILAAIMYI